jgi:hypothetical protein
MSPSTYAKPWMNFQISTSKTFNPFVLNDCKCPKRLILNDCSSNHCWNRLWVAHVLNDSNCSRLWSRFFPIFLLVSGGRQAASFPHAQYLGTSPSRVRGALPNPPMTLFILFLMELGFQGFFLQRSQGGAAWGACCQKKNWLLPYGP